MLKVRSKIINWGESCWGWLNRIALAICDHYFFACSNNITCINVNMPTIKILTVVIRLIALHWPSVTMLNDSYLVNFFNYTQCITVNTLCLMNVMFIKNKFCHHLLFSRSKPVHLSCSTCKRLSRIAWQKHILTRDCQVPKKNKTKKTPTITVVHVITFQVFWSHIIALGEEKTNLWCYSIDIYVVILSKVVALKFHLHRGRF